jgi:hypothetical protein
MDSRTTEVATRFLLSAFCFALDSFQLSSAREVGLGLWNQFVIPAGRLLHWAAFQRLIR